MKDLPIGMQDFKQIITGNYVYVDKTPWFYRMLTTGGNSYFMSRPRRFGKTLTISALYYLLKGEKELFKDTFIYDKWDFKEYPVIRISMTEINCENPETVKKTLRLKLERIYQEYDLSPRTDADKRTVRFKLIFFCITALFYLEERFFCTCCF
ncbi:hypothetical protein FACS1894151_09370 [Spirochaetia bacterium]|nr:hypothetical protein FACS1894151_09370 [Spirochaetia bacterium]